MHECVYIGIEVLHGSHVAWQEEKIPFHMGKEVLSYAKYFHCSCHATWLPCKTSIAWKVFSIMSARLNWKTAIKLAETCHFKIILTSEKSCRTRFTLIIYFIHNFELVSCWFAPDHLFPLSWWKWKTYLRCGFVI